MDRLVAATSSLLCRQKIQTKQYRLSMAIFLDGLLRLYVGRLLTLRALPDVKSWTFSFSCGDLKPFA
jgi:hypothetical protein